MGAHADEVSARVQQQATAGAGCVRARRRTPHASVCRRSRSGTKRTLLHRNMESRCRRSTMPWASSGGSVTLILKSRSFHTTSKSCCVVGPTSHMPMLLAYSTLQCLGSERAGQRPTHTHVTDPHARARTHAA
jgi:hypothetical protein